MAFAGRGHWTEDLIHFTFLFHNPYPRLSIRHSGVCVRRAPFHHSNIAQSEYLNPRFRVHFQPSITFSNISCGSLASRSFVAGEILSRTSLGRY
jgi:hypothetical protein